MISYIDFEEVVDLHNQTVNIYGGLGGFHDEGQLRSVLFHIQNDIYYPTILDKVVHLFFGMVQFHCFTDGNKRTAILSTSLFLERNEIEIADFEIKMEDIAIGIARKDLDKKDLQKIFKAMFESFGYKVN